MFPVCCSLVFLVSSISENFGWKSLNDAELKSAQPAVLLSAGFSEDPQGSAEETGGGCPEGEDHAGSISCDVRLLKVRCVNFFIKTISKIKNGRRCIISI